MRGISPLYKRYHGIETGLLRIQNDILIALDENHSVLLVLLDLSAAFDTIDHRVLLYIRAPHSVRHLRRGSQLD